MHQYSSVVYVLSLKEVSFIQTVDSSNLFDSNTIPVMFQIYVVFRIKCISQRKARCVPRYTSMRIYLEVFKKYISL